MECWCGDLQELKFTGDVADLADGLVENAHDQITFVFWIGRCKHYSLSEDV